MNQFSTATIPGFVWAYRFRPDAEKPERLLDTCAPADLLAEDCFLWLHLNLVDARVGAFLDEFPGLSDEVRAALTTKDAHAAIIVDEQIVHGNLIDFQREFDQDTLNLGWLHFAISDRFIITTRLQPLRSVDRARTTIEKNAARFSRPIDIFEMLVIEFQRTLISMVIEITEEMNLIEDSVYDNALHDERRRLAPVRRTIVRVHRHLRTILSLMKRAAASDEEEMPFGFADVASRLTGRLETVDHDVYALQDRARLLHEEIDSKLSSETNRHLYILSIITAFLLPPTLVTGFFGMNTTSLPFAEDHDGTIYAVTLMVASILIAWWLLKRTNIL